MKAAEMVTMERKRKLEHADEVCAISDIEMWTELEAYDRARILFRTQSYSE